MSTPKWTDERTEQLKALVGDESPVSRETVATVAEDLETTSRSVGAKLRKMGYEVEKATATARAFSDEVTEQLREFVTSNSGVYTYAEIAENFPGDYTPKAIQGKILSMELTDHVKETPKKVTPKRYSDDEEAIVISMAKDNAFIEDIAAKVSHSVQSVRGKVLSLYRAGLITAMPKQRDVKGPAADPFADLDVASMTVEQIAETLDKSERGVKTMLTHRGLKAANYDGAAKKEKAAANS